MDDDGRDLLAGEHDEDAWEDERGPSVLDAVLAPEALALACLVLAVVSVLGLGLLNGSPYLPLAFTGPPAHAYLVWGAVLGAGLALVPAALGVLALRRLPDGSPSRVIAGAGLLVAAVSCLLRLVIAGTTAVSDSPPHLPF